VSSNIVTIQTSDGGYVTTAGSLSGLALMFKINTTGNVVQWAKHYGAGLISGDEYSRAVEETDDGGFIVTGSTGSYGAGNKDVLLFKTNSNGVLQWTKTFGGSDYEGGASVQQTTDKGYVIAADTRSFGQGGYDIFVIKTDSNGSAFCNSSSPNMVESNIAVAIFAGVTTQANQGSSSNPNTIHTIANTIIDSITCPPPVISSCNIVLPIQLIFFAGNITTEGVLLSWSTSNEINNDYFAIERSTDGVSFDNIGETDGQGTSSHLSEYEFVDKAPKDGSNYYRLKQVDYDGQFTYSKIIGVNVSVNNAPVEYIDLYGRKIMNAKHLQPGVYIKKQGDQYNKIIISNRY